MIDCHRRLAATSAINFNLISPPVAYSRSIPLPPRNFNVYRSIDDLGTIMPRVIHAILISTLEDDCYWPTSDRRDDAMRIPQILMTPVEE